MTLHELHETLLEMPRNSLTDALFILVDHMVEAGDDCVNESCGNVGICLTNKVIELVDIANSRSIVQFALTNDPVVFNQEDFK